MNPVDGNQSAYSPPEARDLLPPGRESWSARTLLNDSEYVERYSNLLRGFLASPKVKFKTPYYAQWPLSSDASDSPAVMVIGRATAKDWSMALESRNVSVDEAIGFASRKSMWWFECMRRSQFIMTALGIVEGLSDRFRSAPSAVDDITYSNLYKVARDANPSPAEMTVQGSLGLAELIRQEVAVVKPKLVIALTQKYSPATGTTSRGWFEDILGSFESTNSNCTGVAPLVGEIGGVPCVVGCHPQSAIKVRRPEFVAQVLGSVSGI